MLNLKIKQKEMLVNIQYARNPGCADSPRVNSYSKEMFCNQFCLCYVSISEEQW